MKHRQLNKKNTPHRAKWFGVWGSMLLAVFFVFSNGFASPADDITLSISFRGLRLNSLLQWQAIPLSGRFEVAAGDALLGEIAVNMTDGQNAGGYLEALTISRQDASKGLVLRPVMESMPETYICQDEIPVNITNEANLRVEVLAYAREGLFRLSNMKLEDGQPAGSASFVVFNSVGQIVSSFDTDNAGRFDLDIPLSQGTYTLHQTLAPEGTIPASDMVFEISPYLGTSESIAEILVMNESVPVLGVMFDNMTTKAATVNDLYAADQMADFYVSSNAALNNTISLENVTVDIGPITLQDAWGDALEDQSGMEINSITVTPGMSDIITGIRVLDEQGNTIGEERVLSSDQMMTFAGIGAHTIRVVYKTEDGNAVVPAGFVLGDIRFSVKLSRRVPDANRASVYTAAAGITANWEHKYEGRNRSTVTIKGQSKTITATAKVLDSRASIAVSATAKADGKALLSLLHEGGPNLENVRMAIQLPKGWRVTQESLPAPVYAISHGAVSDILVLSMAGSFGKGMAQEVEFSASFGAGSGVGAYWIQSPEGGVVTLDNPKGLLVRGMKADNSPIADVLLQAAERGTYAYGTWTADNQTNANGSLQVLGFGKQEEASVIPKKGEADLLLQSGNSAWYAVALPNGVTLSGITGGQAQLTVDAAPSHESVWIDAGAFTGDISKVTAVAIHGGQDTVLHVKTDLREGIVSFVTISRTVSGDEVKNNQDVQAGSTAALSGLLFDDANNNGRQDEGEFGAGGQLVFWRGNGSASFHTYTDIHGRFSFSGVKANDTNGSLYIKLPANTFVSGQETPGGLYAINQKELGREKEVQIGFTQMSAVYGRVYVRDTMTGVPGTEVTLTSGGKTISSTVTDANGEYRFDALTMGEYQVSINLPDGLRGSVGFLAQDGYADISGANATITNVILGYGEQAVQDVPIRSLGKVQVMGRGLDQQLGKAVILLNGSLVLENEPLADGSYLFEGLFDGAYTLHVNVPQGMVIRTGSDEPYQKGYVSLEFDLAPGESKFIEIEKANTGKLAVSLSGIGLNGSPVYLIGPEAVEAILDDNGQCLFDDLIPGTYQIKTILPNTVLADDSGVWQITAVQGGKEAVLTVDVLPGEQTCTKTAQLSQSAKVNGIVFEDGDHDGTHNGNEAAVAAVQVEIQALQDGTWVKLQNAITGEDGTYQFENLNPGQYRLSVTMPQGKALADTGVLEAFQLTSGQAFKVNIAANTPAAIIVNAFWDSNNDGQQGIYERPIEGTMVEVLPVSGDGTVVVAQMYTNRDGLAIFDQVAPGNYELRLTLPDGYWLSTQGNQLGLKQNSLPLADSRQGVTEPFTLAQGGAIELGVGGVRTGYISGRIWLDENEDGIMAQGEPGLAGCTVTLRGSSGGQSYQVITDDTGWYKIIARVDSYVMTVQGPEGMSFTRFSTTGGVNRSIFTTEGTVADERKYLLESGSREENQNIGFVPGAVLEGIAYLDANFNGVWDEGEQLLGGVALELIRKAGEKSLAAYTTGDDGSFRFDGLRGGEYSLRAALPDAGLVFTRVPANGAAKENLFIQKNGQRWAIAAVKLSSGERRMVGAGAIVPGSLQGNVFEDDNYNGLLDKDEKPIAGVLVRLDDTAGNMIDTETTDASGRYAFEGLMPMEYILSFERPVQTMFTKIAEGPNRSRVIVIQNNYGVTEPVVVAIGENVTDINAGVIPPATVLGNVFGDANDDGLLTEGEAGFAGVFVTLLNEDGETVLSMVTEEDGSYAFHDLYPGRYTLSYLLPEDALYANVTVHGNQILGNGLAALSDAFDLMIGETHTAPLCGAVALGRITGFAFHDANANGKVDGNEAALGGVSLALLRSDGKNMAEVVTDADGIFTLEGLRPGTYQLEAALQSGFIFTRQGEGILMPSSDENKASLNLDLQMGEKLDGQLIGGTMPASLYGRVWLDENNNGAMDDGESLLQGIGVSITDNLTGSLYTRLLTDEQGAFTLPVMHPGIYDITVDLPHNGVAADSAVGESSFVDAEPGSMVLKDYVLSQGDVIADLRAGVRQYTSIEGTTWVDGQGHIVPLSGVNVFLYAGDNLSTPIKEAITGEDGAYRFDQLMPGDYRIGAVLPEGYLMIKPHDERLVTGQGVSIIADLEMNISDILPVYMGEDRTGQDIGALRPGMLGDLAWLDENRNGLQDTGEPGIPGMTVTLYQEGVIVGETVTNAYGYYLFENVYPMTSLVHVSMYEELVPTVLLNDFPLLASSVAGHDGSTAFTGDVMVVSGGRSFNCDLGFVLKDGAKKPDVIQTPEPQKWK